MREKDFPHQNIKYPTMSDPAQQQLTKIVKESAKVSSAPTWAKVVVVVDRAELAPAVCVCLPASQAFLFVSE